MGFCLDDAVELPFGPASADDDVYESQMIQRPNREAKPFFGGKN